MIAINATKPNIHKRSKTPTVPPKTGITETSAETKPIPNPQITIELTSFFMISLREAFEIPNTLRV